MRKLMTPSAFVAGVSLTRLSPDRTAAAYAVLVEGKTWCDAAAPYGWKRQALFSPVATIRKNYERYAEAQRAAQDPEASIKKLLRVARRTQTE